MVRRALKPSCAPSELRSLRKIVAPLSLRPLGKRGIAELPALGEGGQDHSLCHRGLQAKSLKAP